MTATTTPSVITLDLPHLGNRCHLVHDGARALVVDPPRDLAAVEAAAEEAQLEIAAVADTHVHNDYLSGALGLARRHGADYLLSADEPVEFERVGVRGGDLLEVGRLAVRVIDTPGHTRHHQAFLASYGDGPGALFSGGSLLHGTVGRTDLVDPALTATLAAAQWQSARTLGHLPPATRLHPTHGFGSFCAGGVTAGPDAGTPTVEEQRAANPALQLDRDPFVEALVTGFGPYPAYYRHMGPLNRAGSGRRRPRPSRRLALEELLDARERGAWLVDLRPRRSYAAGHLPGTVGIEYGAQFATYVGWLVPWGAELVLLTPAGTDPAPALTDLAAIGIEGVATFALDGAAHGDQPTERYRVADWADWVSGSGSDPDLRTPRVLLDVRQRDEHDAGHLPGSVHVPLQDLPARIAQVPSGEVWVHCRSGFRAGIAAALLARAGRSVVHLDDDWERVAGSAVPRPGRPSARVG
jgi:glyoxylase-like metal-dependent hydrolase (beta-lactamase superfamily II)/rhodanese-related sulfurtransferase